MLKFITENIKQNYERLNQQEPSKSDTPLSHIREKGGHTSVFNHQQPGNFHAAAQQNHLNHIEITYSTCPILPECFSSTQPVKSKDYPHNSFSAVPIKPSIQMVKGITLSINWHSLKTAVPLQVFENIQSGILTYPSRHLDKILNIDIIEQWAQTAAKEEMESDQRLCVVFGFISTMEDSLQLACYSKKVPNDEFKEIKGMLANIKMDLLKILSGDKQYDKEGIVQDIFHPDLFILLLGNAFFYDRPDIQRELNNVILYYTVKSSTAEIFDRAGEGFSELFTFYEAYLRTSQLYIETVDSSGSKLESQSNKITQKLKEQTNILKNKIKTYNTKQKKLSQSSDATLQSNYELYLKAFTAINNIKDNLYNLEVNDQTVRFTLPRITLAQLIGANFGDQLNSRSTPANPLNQDYAEQIKEIKGLRKLFTSCEISISEILIKIQQLSREAAGEETEKLKDALSELDDIETEPAFLEIWKALHAATLLSIQNSQEDRGISFETAQTFKNKVKQSAVRSKSNKKKSRAIQQKAKNQAVQNKTTKAVRPSEQKNTEPPLVYYITDEQDSSDDESIDLTRSDIRQEAQRDSANEQHEERVLATQNQDPSWSIVRPKPRKAKQLRLKYTDFGHFVNIPTLLPRDTLQTFLGSFVSPNYNKLSRKFNDGSTSVERLAAYHYTKHTPGEDIPMESLQLLGHLGALCVSGLCASNPERHISTRTLTSDQYEARLSKVQITSLDEKSDQFHGFLEIKLRNGETIPSRFKVIYKIEKKTNRQFVITLCNRTEEHITKADLKKLGSFILDQSRKRVCHGLDSFISDHLINVERVLSFIAQPDG